MKRLAVTAAAALGILLAACATDARSEDARTSTDDIMVAGFRSADIQSSDGVVLKALVIEPDAPGLHPAIVFPSSWGLFDGEYVAQAKKLAGAGYTVLAYTPRGWWSSGGEVDTAGPKDVADARAVIDWLIAETSADPEHIGMAGVSYGAGISLLASAFDSRVRAVGALSGWTDLIASLFADDTRRQQTVALLSKVADLVGKPSAEFKSVIADFHAARNIPHLKAWGAVRSAATYLPAINQSRPAILIANAYGDSIFPPNQLVDFIGALEGPHRLELRRGDHAIPEATGLVGLPNGAWDSLRAWMDAYLRGGVAPANGIQLSSENDGPTEFSSEWADTSDATKRFELGFSRHVGLDIDTVAYGGIALITGAVDALTGVPPITDVKLVDPLHAVTWVGPRGAQAIRGIPVVHLEVTPNRKNGTLVSYLYDVDAAGIGRLITHAPASWLDATPGEARTVEVKLPAADYDVASDHRIALVVDGKDPLYIDWNGYGSAVDFSGRSWVELPLR